MKKRYLLLFLLSVIFQVARSQTNIISTNLQAEQVLLGNYNPALYVSPAGIASADSISQGIMARVSADSLKEYIIKLASFKNRNTGSDTLSPVTGIGAARTWIHQKFAEISAQNGNRLIPSYLQFDQAICGVNTHKNVFAVLPGADTSNHKVILIEGHMDSRCAGACDTVCTAEGVEDNASGTALVIELARAMSQYSFDHTIVFMATTGEEQGLLGANAFATNAVAKQIPVVAVLNNDVIGGIYCGATASPPACPSLDHIDSTQVRLFSYGGFNSPHKQLARYIKLQYKEELLPIASVPMMVTIMSAEDRTGRGGDHIPFRQKGFPAMRFTSANEHGDASNGPGYTDRQHTHTDLLGADTNGDMIIDSFFVDFNYLARNAVINGNAAGLIAISPEPPDMTLTGGGLTLVVDILPIVATPYYRIAVRSTTNDWDSVYTTSILHNEIVVPVTGNYKVSVAAMDTAGVESLFSDEYVRSLSPGIEENDQAQGIELLQNRPNPFDETTIISVMADDAIGEQMATIVVTDASGRVIKQHQFILQKGMNEMLYEHGYGATGIYYYHLYLGDKKLASKSMVFAN